MALDFVIRAEILSIARRYPFVGLFNVSRRQARINLILITAKRIFMSCRP